MKETNEKLELTKEEKLKIIHSMGANTEHVLAILLELQDKSSRTYIDEETAQLVANEVGISTTHIYDILTFYAMLEVKPKGQYILEVCNSTPCHYNKSNEVMQVLEKELNIKVGETTDDHMFSLIYTQCVGACDIGPVIRIKDDVYGDLDEEKIKNLISRLKATR